MPSDGPEFTWDNEPCPRDCEGDLQQQDYANVNCLECGATFTHQRDETEHRLIYEMEFVARKPRAIADGGHAEAVDQDPPNHVVVDVPAGGKETATEALNYRVGPACNWQFFYGRRKQKLILWGENLSESTLRQLGDACFDLKQEHKEMDFFEAAQAADRMESNFVFADTPYLHSAAVGGEEDDV